MISLRIKLLISVYSKHFNAELGNWVAVFTGTPSKARQVLAMYIFGTTHRSVQMLPQYVCLPLFYSAVLYVKRYFHNDRLLNSLSVCLSVRIRLVIAFHLGH